MRAFARLIGKIIRLFTRRRPRTRGRDLSHEARVLEVVLDDVLYGSQVVERRNSPNLPVPSSHQAQSAPMANVRVVSTSALYVGLCWETACCSLRDCAVTRTCGDAPTPALGPGYWTGTHCHDRKLRTE